MWVFFLKRSAGKSAKLILIEKRVKTAIQNKHKWSNRKIDQSTQN